jgi:hypothetical protein
LLRLFGPLWSNKEDPAIPYITASDRATQPFLTNEEVLACIIDDLIAAADLIKTIDPVFTDGPGDYSSNAVIDDNNDWNYRQYRLNYFAIRTLLARAYLWGGDKAKAGETARDVIAQANNSETPLFPLTSAGLQGIVTDRMFSKEVLFALYNTSRTTNIYSELFSPDLEINKILYMFGDVGSGRASFLYDDLNDYRYKMLSTTVNSNITFSISLKYESMASVTGTERHRYMIPLIRLTEAYLIAAECEGDVQTALDNYLNPLRLARNCRDLTADSPEGLSKLIFDEYKREFLGEGQLFYYFKRNELLSIPNGAVANANKAITPTQYKFVVPDSEMNPRTE